MKRVHWHWTAGAPGIIPVEDDSYHFIVDGAGKVTPGTFKVEDNIPPLRPGKYAAHTARANSWAIGIACDAMAGAQERPFRWGSNPLTEAQISGMLRITATVCREYNIKVTRETVLSHAEVQRTLGIKQNAKWDFMVLPGMTRVDDPILVGDELRARLVALMDSQSGVIKGVTRSNPWLDKWNAWLSRQ